ncbi:hypothetical protein [Segniliparus rugosus]|uniref:phage terminase small subunit n=1 Tax=Segniliparus rugosus TaxID=286804 RepID=UPI001FCB795A|nr:hypothetical protein [Segniliparus rugosus]
MPKRSDQRVRRNKEDVPVEKVAAIGAVTVPDLGINDPHPIVKDLYSSLAESAQSRYYEPSDWHFARLAMGFVDGLVKSSRPSAQMLTVVNQMLTDLLITEGARRRVRLEVERDQSEGVVLDVASLFRQRLSESP